MPQNLRGRRPRRFGHNLLIRGGLRAYALTLPLLGFECTWYEIKSKDMNEKGKEFIFYNKPYMPSAGLHGPLHMTCALSPVPAPTLALDLHAYTQLYCLLLLGQRGGGVHVLKCILHSSQLTEESYRWLLNAAVFFPYRGIGLHLS